MKQAKAPKQTSHWLFISENYRLVLFTHAQVDGNKGRGDDSLDQQSAEVGGRTDTMNMKKCSFLDLKFVSKRT